MPSPALNASLAFASLALVSGALAAPVDPPKAEDASAMAQYQALHLSRDPSAALAGTYKLDPHHTSVVARLAHMDLSHYTLRFDDASGSFAFDPASATATHLDITVNPASVDTGDTKFDQRIATKYFEADAHPAIHFTADAVKIVGGHATINGTLDFHGVARPLLLTATYNGFAQSRMGFSGEATFKRSDFGVGQWAPLEGDAVSIVVETEFVRQ
ncbi:YceI family protein [Bacillus sp. NP157]|nr:YceI family protein [Bacillus sp. NP157]